MKQKKRRSNDGNIFAMAHYQRRALWISLDLLHFVKPPRDSNIDFILVDAMSNAFHQLDSKPETLELFLNPREINIAVRALEMATLYLDGMTALFETFGGECIRLASELKENEAVIRNLRNHFTQNQH